MGLFAQSPYQKLYSACLAGSIAAIATAFEMVLGNGPIGSGLVVSAVSGNTVSLSPGFALCGIICQLTAAATLNLAAGTWDIWACDPPFTTSGGVPNAGSYPSLAGIDALVPTVVASGTTPAAPGCLLATVVSTGTAISSINNSPAGKNPLPGPAPSGTRHLAPAQANFTSQPSGSDSAFTLTETPNPAGSLTVFKNGILLDPTVYSLAGAVVTLSAEPLSTDKLSAGFSY
jgi:hypothetical protein